MKNQLLKYFNSVFKARDEKARYQLYVFLICLGLSLFIWTMIKLSEESEAEIEFPVSYSNIPQDKILVNSTMSEIRLRFEEKATKLFHLKFIKKKTPVNISLANMNLQQKGDKYYGYLFTSFMIDYITRQLDLPGTVISVSPDTLFFIFEDRVEKTIPVDINIDISLEKQFMLYDSISVRPDSIVLSGPLSMVDTIEKITIADIHLSDINKTLVLQKAIGIHENTQFLTFTPPQVEITIPVAEYTESYFDIPVRINNSGDHTIKTFPESVRIVYLVALKDYNKVSAEMFSCVADFGNINIETEHKVRVRVLNVPSYVKVTRIEPDEVEYIILKQ